MVTVGPVRVGGDLALCEGEHAQPARRHLVLLRDQCGTVDRNRAALAVHAVGHGDQRLGRPLDEDPHLLLGAVEGRGVAPVRLVGDAAHLGQGRVHLLANDATLARRCEQGDVDRIADAFPAVAVGDEPCLVGQGGGAQEQGRFVAPIGAVRTVDASAFPAAGPQRKGGAVGQADFRRGQLVEGQRAGLVGGDHRARAERLDRRHAPHDDVDAGHAPHADRQDDGDGDGQALGDGADRQADRHEEEVARRHLAEQPDGEEEEHGDADRHRDHPREALESLHQRRPRRRLGADLAGDPADLGRRTGGRHDTPATSTRDRGPGEGAGGPRGIEPSRAAGMLGHGRRFAGEKGFVAAQILRRDEHEVRRHADTGFEEDEIAGHDLAGVYLDGRAVAQHRRLRRLQLAQRRRGAAGRILLHRPDDAVGEKHGRDERRVLDVAEEDGNQRRGEQEINQRAEELLQEQDEKRRARHFGQRVRPSRREPRRRLDGRQTPVIRRWPVRGRFWQSGRRHNRSRCRRQRGPAPCLGLRTWSRNLSAPLP